jgi:Tfp pilus assembly protein PilZ
MTQKKMRPHSLGNPRILLLLSLYLPLATGCSSSTSDDGDGGASVVASWFHQFGTSNPYTPTTSNAEGETCAAIAVDADENVYCAGFTYLGNFGETNAGDSDAVIVKMNASGEVQWVTQLGALTQKAGVSQFGQGSESCSGVAVDSSGNVFCAGSTSGNLGETHAADSGNSDAFVLKLNSAGELQWITQLGAATAAASVSGANLGDDACYSLSVDSSGNAYCGGSTDGNLGETNAGGRDAFVLKLNSAGELQWVKQLGTTTKVAGLASANAGNESCEALALATDGSIHCGGNTDGNLGEVNGGNTDAFVLKLASTGALSFVKQLGSVTKKAGVASANADNDECRGIVTDGSGNIYCSGTTGGNLGEVNAGAGSGDIFVTKFSSAGELVWITQLGQTTKIAGVIGANVGSDYANGLAIGSDGSLYVAGTVYGQLGESNGGSSDAFVAQFSSDGTLGWVSQLGATRQNTDILDANAGGDSFKAVAVGASGAIYCGGNTDGNMDDINADPDPTNSDDLIIAKFTAAGEIDF